VRPFVGSTPGACYKMRYHVSAEARRFRVRRHGAVAAATIVTTEAAAPCAVDRTTSGRARGHPPDQARQTMHSHNQQGE